MTQLLQRFERKHMIWLVNSLVFLFFVTVLTFKKGYSYAPMALAGIGIIYLFIHIFKLKKPLNFSREDKWLIFAFVFYFGTFAFSAIYHGDGFREIDNPSRVLLFLPLLLLFREFPINIKVILHGIPIGAAVAGLISIYQKFYLGQPRAYSEIISIQGGDIAMSLGVFTLLTAIYFFINRGFFISVFYTVFGCLGIFGSIFSGSRGGWIVIPFIVVNLFIFFRKEFSLKIKCLFVVFSVVLSILIIMTPQFQERMINLKDQMKSYFDNTHTYTSFGDRVELWKFSANTYIEHPILGVGSKNYLKLKEEKSLYGLYSKNIIHYNDSHNQYLDSLGKRGGIGFIGLLGIIVIPFRLFYKELKKSNLKIRYVSMLGAFHIISVIIYGLTQSFFNHNSGSIFYFFLVFIFYCYINRYDK